MPGDASAPAGGPGVGEGMYYFLLASAMALFGAFFVPPLLLVVPAPLAALVYRRGYRSGVLAGLLVAFGVFGLQAAVLGGAPGLVPSELVRQFQLGMLVWLLVVGLVGLSIGGNWREGAGPSATLLWGAAAFAVPPMLVYAAARVGWQVDLIDLVLASWDRLGAEIAAQQELGVVPAEVLAQMSDWVQLARSSFEAMRPILPAFLLSTALAGSTVSVAVGRWLLRWRTPTPEGLPPFQLWRFPWWVVLGFILGQGLAVLDSLKVPLGILAVVGDNLHLFFSNVFLVQGLAVIYYYLTRRPLPSLLRMGIMVFAAFWLSFVIMWLGVLDSWFNFRRLGGEEAGDTGPR